VLVAVIINKKRLYNYYREALCRADGSSDNPVPKEPQGNKSPNVEKAVDHEKLTDEIEKNGEREIVCDCRGAESANVEESENILDQPDHIAHVSIDAGYADSAISDSLARNLLRKDECVYTSGYKRGIVNVDTLSRSFDEGERVDVNILKEKSLIPYDTAYIKVLARGIIDKPLTVYANDFSLSAVKMIALAGGKAIKVKTVIGKERKNT
jgi:ribosomal protein L18E